MDECIQISEQTSQDMTDIVGSSRKYRVYVLHELRPDVWRDKMHKLAMPRLENDRECYLSSKKPERTASEYLLAPLADQAERCDRSPISSTHDTTTVT